MRGKSKIEIKTGPPNGSPAFTLAESMVAMGVTGIMVTALYAGINCSFYSVRLARENLRATEILLDKMEALRVCSWDQINSNGFILPTFTELYNPPTTNNTPGAASSSEGSGVVYNGDVVITSVSSAQLNATYNGDLRQITINLSWNSGSQNHARQVTTYVSRYGIQSCLFN